MNNLNPETVCNIIIEARRLFAKEENIPPEDKTESQEFRDDVDYQLLADDRNDLITSELRNIINDLEPDQQAALVALFWVGRGDYGPEEWDTAFEEAERVWTKRTADYLLTKPLLASFLQEGLTAFGYDCDV